MTTLPYVHVVMDRNHKPKAALAAALEPYGWKSDSWTAVAAMKRPSPWLFAPDRTPVVNRQALRNTSIGGLSFALEIDGENVPMRISEGALRGVFGAERCRSTWWPAYRRNANEIERRAVAAYRRAPGRPVCLEVADFAVPAG